MPPRSLEVRYTDDVQSDTSVIRHLMHTLWEAVLVVRADNLAAFRSGFLLGQKIEIKRGPAADRYNALSIGNAIGYGVPPHKVKPL